MDINNVHHEIDMRIQAAIERLERIIYEADRRLLTDEDIESDSDSEYEEVGSPVIAPMRLDFDDEVEESDIDDERTVQPLRIQFNGHPMDDGEESDLETVAPPVHIATPIRRTVFRDIVIDSTDSTVVECYLDSSDDETIYSDDDLL